MTLSTRVLLWTAVVSVGLIVWWRTSGRVAVPADGVASDPSAESSPPPSIADRAPVLAGAAGAKRPAASPHGGDDATLPNSAAVPASPLEPAHLTGVVRDAKTKATIVGARILVGVNERTMHELRVVANPPLEARTDAQGRFSLEVPVPAEGLTIRVDAMSKGYRSLAGSYASGAGDAPQVPVKPGDAKSVELELVVGFAVAGVVRDETGSPVEDVQIEAHEENKNFTQYVAFTRTDRDGRFEVYDFDVAGDSEQHSDLAEARLHLDHADFVPLVSDDLRKRTESERTSPSSAWCAASPSRASCARPRAGRRPGSSSRRSTRTRAGGAACSRPRTGPSCCAASRRGPSCCAPRTIAGVWSDRPG